MQHVKQLLKDNGISQRNLASHLSVSPAAVNLILNRINATRQTIIKGQRHQPAQFGQPFKR